MFNGMEIANDPSLCDQYMGKYPVLSISLKDVDGLDFRTAYDMLCIAVSEEARRFGQVDIYCPWDVINQCNKFLETKEAPMEAHWENSSSNVIVQDILTNATETTKGQIEALISGETEEKL